MQTPNWMRLSRQPDETINGFLFRWLMLPKNKWLNIYLHHLIGDDPSALHDHPWANCSILIKGQYLEVVPKEPRLWPSSREEAGVLRSRGSVVFRRAEAPHRLVKMGSGSWTIFITWRRKREWGFWCPQGWRHNTEFTAGPNGEYVGKGCGE